MNRHTVTTKWNIFDSVIFYVEYFISRLVISIKESKDELPDPGEMIEAATKELQEENDALKWYRIPGWLVKQGDVYMCPNCTRKLTDVARQCIKYCPGCGKRIIEPSISHYRNSNYVNNMGKGNKS